MTINGVMSNEETIISEFEFRQGLYTTGLVPT